MVNDFLKMLKKPARRGLSLLAGFVLLTGGCAFGEEDLDIGDLADIEEIELPAPDATLNARDIQWHTPGEGSPVQCDHENCYWKIPMGYTDEDAVWKMLMQPITVLDVSERKQYKIRKEPRADCTEYVGEVTGTSQGVHVLQRGEEWSLIEA